MADRNETTPRRRGAAAPLDDAGVGNVQTASGIVHRLDLEAQTAQRIRGDVVAAHHLGTDVLRPMKMHNVRGASARFVYVPSRTRTNTCVPKPRRSSAASARSRA